MLKKFIQTALLLVVLFTTVQSYAQVSQAPDGIQFQALATDANGHPAAGRVIYVKDAIIAKTATGTIVYSETFKVTASSAGIFTIVLGKGTYASGVSSIANIDWANGPFFLNLKIAVEPTVPNASWNVNNEYVDLGTSQFWSVPYALYAGNVKGADGKLNTSDTAAMLKPYFTAINLKANIESPTFTGTVKGITKAMVGLANVDNTSDLDKPISNATKTSLDLKANAADVTTALALKANAADVTTSLATKVDKVTGKELSTNDYTTAEKTKLAAITGTNTGDQDLSALAVAADVNAALALKADGTSVANSISTISTTLNRKANIIDVNNELIAKADVVAVNDAVVALNTSLSNKENTSNKSVNVTTDAASDIKFPSVKAVKTYVDQIAGNILTGQVNSDWNATLGPSRILNKPILFSGAYSDLTGKPTLFSGSYTDLTNQPAIPAAQVSSDWNASTGGAQILNKPRLFSGAYSDLTGNIPIWNQSTTGNAATATKLAAGKNINGVAFDGSTDITITAAASTLSGTVLVVNGGTGLNAAGTLGQVLTTGANGSLTWSTPTDISVGTISATSNHNGATIAAGVLTLTPADATNGGLITIGNQTFAGTKIFENNLVANGIKVGKGSGGSSTVLGDATSANDNSTALGFMALNGNGGTNNTAIGTNAMRNSSSSAYTTAVGVVAGQNDNAGGYNTFVGYAASVPNSSNISNSTAIGAGAIIIASNTVQLGADGTNGFTAVQNVKTSGTLTAGTVTYPKAHGAANQVLSTTGSGTLTWTTISTVADAATISGTVTVANGGTGAMNAAAALSNLGAAPINANLNDQTGTIYTLDASDNGKVITLNNASAITLTVPASLSVGFNCMIVQKGAGIVTLAPANTVTVTNRNGGTKTGGQNAMVTIISISSNYFIAGGDMQ